MPEEPIESTAVEVRPPADTTHTGGAVAIARPVSQEVLRPLDVGAVRESMEAYQSGLAALLDAGDWQGNPGAKGAFVKKSGWRKIGVWFNLSTEPISEHVERDGDGTPLRARVWVRAVSPTGRAMAGDGACSYAESRFSGPNGNVSKLENDLLATASTRATNRAISNLVGMGKVSAEEANSGAEQSAGPPFGPPASDETIEKVYGAVAELLDIGAGPNTAAATAVLNTLVADVQKQGALEEGYLPKVTARALMLVAVALRNAASEDPDRTAPVPGPAEPAATPAATPAPAAAPAAESTPAQRAEQAAEQALEAEAAKPLDISTTAAAADAAHDADIPFNPETS